MKVLVKFFENNLDVEEIKYKKVKRENLVLDNAEKEIEFKYDYLYLYNFNINNSKLISKIKNGIILRRMEVKNSKIENKINSKKCILVDLIKVNGNLEYEFFGKVNKLYHFAKIIHLPNSNSNIKIRILNKNKTVSIVNSIIPKKSYNSFTSIEKIFINSEKSILISYPILNIKNKFSKGFHSSKILKLESDQIFYLKSKGIKDIEKLIIESIIP